MSTFNTYRLNSLIYALVAVRLRYQANRNLTGFQSQLESSCVSSHTYELLYKTVGLWMTMYIKIRQIGIFMLLIFWLFSISFDLMSSSGENFFFMEKFFLMCLFYKRSKEKCTDDLAYLCWMKIIFLFKCLQLIFYIYIYIYISVVKAYSWWVFHIPEGLFKLAENWPADYSSIKMYATAKTNVFINHLSKESLLFLYVLVFLWHRKEMSLNTKIIHTLLYVYNKEKYKI